VDQTLIVFTGGEGKRGGSFLGTHSPPGRDRLRKKGVGKKAFFWERSLLAFPRERGGEKLQQEKKRKNERPFVQKKDVVRKTTSVAFREREPRGKGGRECSAQEPRKRRVSPKL